MSKFAYFPLIFHYRDTEPYIKWQYAEFPPYNFTQMPCWYY